MRQSRPLFVYFFTFLFTVSKIQIEKSVDGVLGIQTQGRRMVGTDETRKLWWPPIPFNFWLMNFAFFIPTNQENDWTFQYCCLLFAKALQCFKLHAYGLSTLLNLDIVGSQIEKGKIYAFAELCCFKL